jgi:hypothetical protein
MEFLKEILGEELYAQVAAKLEGNKDVKLANLATGEYVSKSKHEAEQLAKDKRIQELTDKIKNFEGVDVKQLQTDVENWKIKYNQDLESARLDSAIQLAIAKSGTLSEKALMGLLNKDEIKFDKDGKLTGLDEQIEAIKKEDSFLFKAAEPNEPKKGNDVVLDGNHEGSPKPEAPTTLAGAISEYYKK